MSDPHWARIGRETPEEWLDRVQRQLAEARAELQETLAEKKQAFRTQMVWRLEGMENAMADMKALIAQHPRLFRQPPSIPLHPFSSMEDELTGLAWQEDVEGRILMLHRLLMAEAAKLTSDALPDMDGDAASHGGRGLMRRLLKRGAPRSRTNRSRVTISRELSCAGIIQEEGTRLMELAHRHAPVLLAEQEEAWEAEVRVAEEALCDTAAGWIEQILELREQSRSGTTQRATSAGPVASSGSAASAGPAGSAGPKGAAGPDASAVPSSPAVPSGSNGSTGRSGSARTSRSVKSALVADGRDLPLPLGMDETGAWRMLFMHAQPGEHLLVVAEKEVDLYRWMKQLEEMLLGYRTHLPMVHVVTGSAFTQQRPLPGAASQSVTPTWHRIGTGRDLDRLHEELRAVVQERSSLSSHASATAILYVLLDYPTIAAEAGSEAWHRFQGLMATVMKELPRSGIHFLCLQPIEPDSEGDSLQLRSLQHIASQFPHSLHVGGHPDLNPYPAIKAKMMVQGMPSVPSAEGSPVENQCPVYWVKKTDGACEVLWLS